MPTLKRTILVIGAASGIGRAIARNLLEAGHQVIGTSRTIEKFAVPHPCFTPLSLDLVRLEQLPQQLRELEKAFPELNTVIFAAGMGRFGSIEEFAYQQIQELLTINFTSPVFITKALLPGLKRQPHADLIYIGSEAALKGSRKGAIYCAGKFALRGFTQALREECGKSAVRVCLINPGMVKTEFFQSLNFQPGDDPSNYLLPEDIAQAVSYVLNSNPQIVIDELNLNPLNKVVKFKKP